MSEVEITLREATGNDTKELLAISQQVSQETDFLIMDERGMNLPEELLATQLDAIYESDTNFLLLAFADDQAIGAASIRASDEARIAHIGEVGIFIAKDYWGLGLGTLMLEELLAIVNEESALGRLELTVQERNPRAIHLYEKFDFQTEAILARGAKSEDGEYLDVRLMSLLVGE